MNPKIVFSAIDKKILKILLEPEGKITSDLLAKKLDLPRTTVQRRRQYLEKRFIRIHYSLSLEDLGFRRIDLFISTEYGKTTYIEQNLLKRAEVVMIGKLVGQNKMNLKAEIIIKDNGELLELLEVIKGIDGVRDVEWVETVKIVGRKKSIPEEIIDKL